MLAVIVWAARLLFATIFVVMGIGHLTKLSAMGPYAEMNGLKPGKLWVALSGLMILAGGIMIITGFGPDLGALLIFLFLIGTAFLMHRFWKAEGQMRQMEQTQFFKDLALAGAAFGFFVLFQIGPGLADAAATLNGTYRAANGFATALTQLAPLAEGAGAPLPEELLAGVDAILAREPKFIEEDGSYVNEPPVFGTPLVPVTDSDPAKQAAREAGSLPPLPWKNLIDL